MKQKAGYKAFLVFTVILFTLLLMEWMGFFEGVNEWMNSVLPLGGRITSLLTDTASSTFTALYILLFVLWDFKDSKKLSIFTLELTVGIVVSMVIVGLLKILIGVPRPGAVPVHWGLLESIKNADYFAFPSGHTARAAVLAYFLSRRWKRLWPLWWGWAAAIALTRLLLHVHWFSDVLFAFMLGPWAGMAVELTESWWLPIYQGIIRRLKLGVFDVEQLP